MNTGLVDRAQTVQKPRPWFGSPHAANHLRRTGAEWFAKFVGSSVPVVFENTAAA